MHITVKVPGSCGELVQGAIDGGSFLVTFPINLYTTVHVTDQQGDFSPLMPKAGEALKRVLAFLGADSFPYAVQLKSELPPGKGMASSSADIAAVCFAAAAALDLEISPKSVAQIAAAIEPTDGVFFSGVVQLNHMNGELLYSFGSPPPLRVLIFDTGGSVDTLRFHQRADLSSLVAQKELQIKKALQLLQCPLTEKMVAEAATISALANQRILYKQPLEQVLSFVREFGALGINAAHSGTVFGVLFSSAVPTAVMRECKKRVLYQYPFLQYLCEAQLIAGGCSIESFES